MKRIRIGNDFVYLWSIERGGEPENLDVALEKKLLIKVFKTPKSIPFTTTGNVIRVELTPDICSIVGIYNLEFSYKLPDMSLSDDERTCTVDIDAFQIVGKSAQADEVEEISSTSDVAIGLSGKDAFEVWLEDNPGGTKEDYFNWLQKPATDAVSLIEDKIETLDTAIQQESERVEAEDIRLSNEQSRVEAEALRVTAEALRATAEASRVSAETPRVTAEALRVQAENERETAELTRQSSESERNENEGLRVNAENLRATAEQERELAESLRVEAELLRQSNTQEAISNAENATENANTAAQNADDARLAIQSDLALKADQADLVQLESDVEQLAYVKIKNEVVNGNFENGLIAPFYRSDGGGGASTLAINSSTPISGNYDIRLTITTPSTGARPIFLGLNGAANIGDKIYLHFYAKILSGIPRINSIGTGVAGSSSSIYAGDIINGRNTRIIDVVGTGANSGTIYFNSTSVWDMQMDNFMRINLTEAFGAGNEPTEEEMSLLLDIAGISYIDDEVIIPAQKIMQWQLALIRKNKNAIIALGGTII